MKKRFVSVLCVLTVLLAVLAATAVAADNAGKIYVGYAKTDINPWVDPLDHSKGIAAIPLAGYSTPHERLAMGRIDDNGDGKVDDNDGLFATCTAIKDGNGKLLLFISYDFISAGDSTVSNVRKKIMEELGDQYDLTPEQIMISASHSHYSPNLSYSSASYVNSGKIDEETRAAVEKYIDYLYGQLTLAATNAVENLSEVSNISKSTTSANDTTRLYMNAVRHYKMEAEKSEWSWSDLSNITLEKTWYAGDNFGSNARAGTTYNNNHRTLAGYKVTSATHVTQANDQMHLLQFTFSDGSQPVVIANWRAHTTLNGAYDGRNADQIQLNPGVSVDDIPDSSRHIGYYCVSSSYVNAFRYGLEKLNNRVCFIQGAAGNINPESMASNTSGWVENGWHIKYAEDAGFSTTDSNNYPNETALNKWKNSVIEGNIYGQLLSSVAVEGLKSEKLETCAAGDIQTMQMRYGLERHTFADQLPGLKYAAQEYQEERNNYLNGTSTSAPAIPYVYEYEGKKYIINSEFHASSVISKAKALENNSFGEDVAKLELNAIMLGPDIAFVTAPVELYDYYDADGSTQPADNDWLLLDSSKVGGTYGTPFVMGYCNANHDYLPSTAAFRYNADSGLFGQGAYGANTAECAVGSGEAVIAAFGKMLRTLNGVGENTIKTVYCQHCKEDKEWKPLFAENAANINLYHDHYYLAENIDGNFSRQKNLLAGQSICVDLNGYTMHSRAKNYCRVFYVPEEAVLNIMDSKGTGKLLGNGCVNLNTDGSENYFSGGVIAVEGYGTSDSIPVDLPDGVLNLYGGTLQKIDTEGLKINSGGAVSCSGIFNMYGGNVVGSSVYKIGGAIYCNSRGCFNMYGGTVIEGVNGDGTPNAVNVYNNFKMYGGTIQGGVTLTNTGNCYVSGKSVIDGGAGMNLQIPSGKTIPVGELETGAQIRVSATGIFTDANGASENNAQYFTGDTGCYVSPTPTGMFAGDKWYCECGGTMPVGHTCQNIAWKEWSGTTALPTTNGNYYLKDNVTITSQIGMGDDRLLRLDLNGKDITHKLPTYDSTTTSTRIKNTRVFYLNGEADLVLTDSTDSPGTVSRDLSNLTDEQIATITDWGLLVVLAGSDAPTSFTMYNVILEGDNSSTVPNGNSLVSAHDALATFRMYSGEVRGGNAIAVGAVNVAGKAEIYGGTITTGSSTNTSYGKCVHVSGSGNVKLAGNANVEQICFYPTDCSKALTVSGIYTGTTELLYKRMTVTEGKTVGISDDANLIQATLTCAGYPDVKVEVAGDRLKLAATNTKVAAIMNINGKESSFASLQDAINAFVSGGANIIQMVEDCTEEPILVDAGKEVVLDMNGFDIVGAEVNGVIYVKDSMTDSFDTVEGAYGKITGAVTGSGKVLGVPVDSNGITYVKVAEDDGVSFHCLKLQIVSAGVYSAKRGMNYTCDFKGDKWAAAQVDSFGVAVSIANEPTVQNGEFASHCAATVLTDFVSGAEGNSAGSSAITNILRSDYSDDANRIYADMTIFGKTYVKLTDDTCLLGAPIAFSFRDIYEHASNGIDSEGNSIWDHYFADDDKTRLISLYEQFSSVMSDWNISKLVAEYNERLGN